MTTTRPFVAVVRTEFDIPGAGITHQGISVQPSYACSLRTCFQCGGTNRKQAMKLASLQEGGQASLLTQMEEAEVLVVEGSSIPVYVLFH